MLHVISTLRTPLELVNASELPEPKPILPWEHRSFDEVLTLRDDIRLLKRVPVKSDEMQQFYHQFSRELLGQEMKELLDADPRGWIVLPNRFSYHLPLDLRQEIIWVSDLLTEDAISEAILTHVNNRIYPINLNQLIIFERPRNISTRLVRGTIKAVRHLHLWTKVYNSSKT